MQRLLHDLLLMLLRRLWAVEEKIKQTSKY